jgi:hypothetical protein
MARRAGCIVVIAGGVVFLLAVTFLDYVSPPSPHTLWDLTTRLPLVLTIVAVAAVLLAIVSLMSDSQLAAVLAACFSFYLFGQFFPVGAPFYNGLGVGVWLATSATIAMSVGGVLAAAGGFARRFARPS